MHPLRAGQLRLLTSGWLRLLVGRLGDEMVLRAVICVGNAAFLAAMVVCLVVEHGAEDQTGQDGILLTNDEAATAQELLDQCWGESDEESEEEDDEGPHLSDDYMNALILQAATTRLCISWCDAPEVHSEAGRSLARLDKKSGEQGHALHESDAASLLDPEMIMVGAVKVIRGLMMSKICHGKGHPINLKPLKRYMDLGGLGFGFKMTSMGWRMQT